MSMYQDEESYEPPAQGAIPDGEQAPSPPAEQSMETSHAAPGAIPDVGEAPYHRLPSQVAGVVSENVENLKKSPLGRGVGAVLHTAVEPNPEGGSQGILAYLLGAGAADPQTAEKFARPDKHKGVSDDEANLLAIKHAGESGGEAAAWAMLQYNRSAYNAKSSFAKAALNGVNGKASDMQAAANAATKASAHMPDGSHTHYIADPDGVTATVRLPGTSATTQVRLSREQFAQVINPSGEGQFDKVLEHGGMPALLQRAAKVATARDATDADQPAIPGTHDANGKYLGPKEKDKTNYGPELEARSTKVFGKGNVNAEPARQQWMNASEEKELERATRLGVAEETGKARNKTAEIQAGGHVKGEEVRAGARVEAARFRSEAENQKIAARLAEVASKSKDRAAHEAAANLRTKYLNPQITLTADDESLAKEILQAGRPSTPPSPVAGAAQAPQAKTPTGEAPPAPGMKKFQGQWYTEQQYKQKFGH